MIPGPANIRGRHLKTFYYETTELSNQKRWLQISYFNDLIFILVAKRQVWEDRDFDVVELIREQTKRSHPLSVPLPLANHAVPLVTTCHPCKPPRQTTEVFHMTNTKEAFGDPACLPSPSVPRWKKSVRVILDVNLVLIKDLFTSLLKNLIKRKNFSSNVEPKLKQ